MNEPTYTLDQLMQMIRFTRHSKANDRQAYKTRDSLLTAFGRACKCFEDTHGNDSMKNEYVRRRNSNSLTKEFLDRIFPYFPSVTSFEGKPLKFIDYSLATNEAAPKPTVPPIDLRYTAKVVHSAAQRELERASGQSPFDRIRHVDQQGEWWDARELQGILGYDRWENFENAIEKAKLSLVTSDGLEVEHFRDITKLSTAGNGARQQKRSYRLSRHACHLIAINGDPSKPEIAAAQIYFSVQTRRAELMDAGLSPIERTAHIDALVSGQQQLTAVVEGIEDDTKMALSKIDRIMAELVSLKTELQEKTPENKRRQFPLSVQKRVGRLFYEYTRGGGCLGNRHIQVIDANGDKISPMQFDHWDGNESRNVYDNCVPMSLDLHKRKTAGKLTAEERKRIEGFIDWMRMIEDDAEETQLGIF